MEDKEIFGRSESKRLLNILRNKKLYLIAILLIAITCGYFYSFYCTTPMYKSSATILLVKSKNAEDTQALTQGDITLNQKLISTYSEIMTSKKVLGKVIENLGLSMSQAQLDKSVTVKAVSNTEILDISVSNRDPELAASITNELASVFSEEVAKIYNMDNVNIIDKAQVPTTPYNINHAKDMIMAVGLGVVLCCGIIFLFYLFDNTVKMEEDIEEFVGLNSLVSIPLYHKRLEKKKKQREEYKEIITYQDKKSPIAECFRTLRTNIVFTQTDKVIKNILVTSSSMEEGKSWISANMAVTFAESNKRVILVDSDMRKGRQHHIFQAKSKPGLSNCLSINEENDDLQLENMTNYIQETKIPNLHIITCGDRPPNPSELVSSNRMKKLMEILDTMYDVVILDGTPCILVSDSVVLSSMVDTTVIVTEYKKTKIENMQRIKKCIESVGGNISGIVLNKIPVTKKEYSSKYYYGDKVKNKNKEEIKAIEGQVDRGKSVQEIIEELKGKSIYQENDFSTIIENNSTQTTKAETISTNKEESNQPTYIENFYQNDTTDLKARIEITSKEVNSVKDLFMQYIIEQKSSKAIDVNKIENLNEKVEELKNVYQSMLTEAIREIKLQLQDNSNQEITSQMLEQIKKQIEDDSSYQILGQRIEELKQEMQDNTEYKKLQNKIENIQDSMQNNTQYEVLHKAIEEIKEQVQDTSSYDTLQTAIEELRQQMQQEDSKQQIEDTMKQLKEQLQESLTKEEFKENMNMQMEKTNQEHYTILEDRVEQIRQGYEEITKQQLKGIQQELIEQVNQKMEENSILYLENMKNAMQEHKQVGETTEQIEELHKEIASLRTFYQREIQNIVLAIEQQNKTQAQKLEEELEELRTYLQESIKMEHSQNEVDRQTIAETNKKIVDINEFKKPETNNSYINNWNGNPYEKEKKNKKESLLKTIFRKEPEYELKEDIPSEDLEETAVYTCQILNRKKQEAI